MYKIDETSQRPGVGYVPAYGVVLKWAMTDRQAVAWEQL
jgi:hypothetical protein